MGRTVRDSNLATRGARLRLAVRGEPYWRALEAGLALGYRRRSAGGTWLARRRAESGGYVEKKLGVSDDLQNADGQSLLDYGHAQEAARAWWRGERRREEGFDAPGGPLTVSDAIGAYLKALKRRGGKSVYHAERTAETHIKPTLGNLQAAKLTAKRIAEWHQALAEKPALARSKPGRARNHRKVDASADGIRKRRATANRILTVLKAALNHAWKGGHIATDDAWRRVRPFSSVETARVRYLNQAECVRLVNGSDPDFRDLVRGALLTGCRYSELTRMHVADFNPDAGVVTVAQSKSGKPRHVVLTDEGRQLFAGLVAGRIATELVFRRPDGDAWGNSHQLRPMAEACKRAKLKPAIGFHGLRHTYGSTLAMKGVPMGVIAGQLGHADTRMTEKHYAHLAPSYVADTIREHFPVLGINGRSTARAIR